MATKTKTPKDPPRRVATAKSSVTFSTHAGEDGGGDFFQIGPLFLQSPTFSDTDPFVEAMRPSLGERTRQAEQQAVRALELLKQVTGKE